MPAFCTCSASPITWVGTDGGRESRGRRSPPRPGAAAVPLKALRCICPRRLRTRARSLATTELLARAVERNDWVVAVRPDLVVEIAFNDLQASPRYPGKLALRFARVKGYRPDKSADEADTIETVRAIYAGQMARTSDVETSSDPRPSR